MIYWLAIVETWAILFLTVIPFTVWWIVLAFLLTVIGLLVWVLTQFADFMHY